MADSSNNNQSSGNRSRDRNRGGNRNRNRSGGEGNRNSNRSRSSNRSGGGGGSGGRRFVKQKVPRRTRPLTLWEKFLNLFGLGPKRRQAPQPSTPSREGNAAASLNAAPPSRPKKKAENKASPPRTERSERPARKPEKVEVNGTRLHVGNLSYDTTDADLEKLFGEIGPVARSEVVMHSRSQRSKGFAFVEMEDIDDAKRAADTLHDKEFMGRPISVGGAKSAKPA